MNDRNSLTVVEQVVPDYTTTFTTSVVNDLSGGVQNTTFGSEQYKLTQVIGSSMGWADFVKIRDLGAARESEALKAAALRLATDIDAYILGYAARSEEHTSELQSLMRISYAVFCLKKKKKTHHANTNIKTRAN